MKKKTKPNVLLLDIETLPGDAYVWSLWDGNIPIGQLKKPSRVVCWAAKWYGKRGVVFASEWDHGRDGMLAGIHALLSEADAVVTYNGDKFDLPKLMGEFAKERMGSPGPLTSIDLYKTVRKMGYISNKLEHVAPLLGVGEKVKHEGFRLWKSVDEGDKKAQKKMERYNKQDTRLLEELYEALIPFITNHPYLHDTDPTACPACGSDHVQRRGHRRTKAFIIERFQCQSCGGWHQGKRSKIK